VEKVVAFMQNRSRWKGPTTQFAAEIGLDCLPNQLSRRLVQSQELLQQQGLTLTRDRSKSSRTLEIVKVEEKS
jgi:hypothetical protein